MVDGRDVQVKKYVKYNKKIGGFLQERRMPHMVELVIYQCTGRSRPK